MKYKKTPTLSSSIFKKLYFLSVFTSIQPAIAGEIHKAAKQGNIKKIVFFFRSRSGS